MRRVFAYAMAFTAALALAACAGTPARMSAGQAPAAQQAAAATLGALTIGDPWVRPVNPSAPAPTAAPDATPAMGGATEMPTMITTGGYLTVTNSGDEADYLVAATAPGDLVDVVELHTVIEEGGMMRMRPVERIEVPAGGEVMLRPGGFHVMFIGVKQELKPGDVVRLSLTFERAGTVDVDAVVRPASPMP